MAVGYEQVRVAIVVEIAEASSPPQTIEAHVAQLGQERGLGERELPLVVVERVVVVLEIGHEQIQPTVAVVVTGVDPHPRLGAAILAVSRSRQ